MPPVAKQRTQILRWWDGHVLWEGDGALPEVLAQALDAGADLRSANLGGANLRSANLGGANLGGANLGAIRDDLYLVLASAPREVPGLLAALKEGRVDGSTYSGACACLVGTIANVAGCEYDRLPGLEADANRPAERWFLAIAPGGTPENSEVSAITVRWVEEWMATHPVAAEVR